MTLLGYSLLFFFSGFTQYLLQVDKGNSLGLFLLLAMPIVGVYFLGWWALLTFFVGLMVGARIFAAKVLHESLRNKPE